MLINASIFSEYDRINGVSANIMLGQLPPCGTGDNEVLLDEDLYVQYVKDMGVHNKNYTSKHTSADDDDEYPQVYQEGCSVDDIAFTFNLPEKTTQTTMPSLKVSFV